MTDRDAIWAAVNGIYDGFLAGDRAQIDRHISPDATVWDSEHEPLLRGKAELDALRDARPAGAPKPAALVATDPVIHVHGDIGIVRHMLTASFDGLPDLRIRNTSVWQRVGDRWLCVHNHEDLRP